MTKSIISEVRFREKKTSIGASITKRASQNLIKIHDTMRHNNQSQMIEYCINTVFDYGLYGTPVQVIQNLKKIAGELGIFQNQPVPDGRGKQSKEADDTEEKLTKEALVAKYGGETVNGVTKYTKYEVTAMGDVVMMKQSMPLRSLPDGEEELRKFILGPYSTLAEAQIEYDKANKK